MSEIYEVCGVFFNSIFIKRMTGIWCEWFCKNMKPPCSCLVFIMVKCDDMGASKSRPKKALCVHRVTEPYWEEKELNDGKSPPREIPGSWRGRTRSSSRSVMREDDSDDEDEDEDEDEDDDDVWGIFEFERFRAGYWELFPDSSISVKQNSSHFMCGYSNQCVDDACFRVDLLHNEWRCWKHYIMYEKTAEEVKEGVEDGGVTWFTLITYKLCQQIFNGCRTEGLTEVQIERMVREFFHWIDEQKLFIDIPSVSVIEMREIEEGDAKVCRAASLKVVQALYV